MSILLADHFFADSNYIEAGLWIVIGLCFAIRTIAKPAFRGECSIAALTFILFGFSDIVEASTGAWWRPWWLFVWKAICVLIFLLLVISYYRWKRVVNPRISTHSDSNLSDRPSPAQNPCPTNPD